MTADDARRIVNESRAASSEAARLTLGYWHRAIESAARAGRCYVLDDEIDRPRMPVSAAAVQAALDQLAAAGFVVDRVDIGRNETCVRVSWLA